jgi:hypothetical protein
LRSASLAGRNRSSPHHRSTRAQSIPREAGISLTALSTFAAIRPPVSTTLAVPRIA